MEGFSNDAPDNISGRTQNNNQLRPKEVDEEGGEDLNRFCFAFSPSIRTWTTTSHIPNCLCFPHCLPCLFPDFKRALVRSAPFLFRGSPGLFLAFTSLENQVRLAPAPFTAGPLWWSRNHGQNSAQKASKRVCTENRHREAQT